MTISEKHPVKPNFLIVGAAKSGTTSLYHYLKEHPDVFMPDWKEPSYFAPPEAGGVTTEKEYIDLFKSVRNETAIGEASVAYLYIPDAPKKIQSFLGNDVKIIILLRNPVDMAYSLWGHQQKEGFERLSFEKALEKEQERLETNKNGKLHDSWIENYAYLSRAKYREQIERYEQTFPPENIRIYLYEDFFQKKLPFYPDLCQFLEIDPSITPVEKTYNQFSSPYFVGLQRILNEENHFKSIFKKLLPVKLRSAIKNRITSLNNKKTKRPPLSTPTRKMLEKAFESDVRWLEKKLQRDLTDIWF